MSSESPDYIRKYSTKQEPPDGVDEVVVYYPPNGCDPDGRADILTRCEHGWRDSDDRDNDDSGYPWSIHHSLGSWWVAVPDSASQDGQDSNTLDPIDTTPKPSPALIALARLALRDPQATVTIMEDDGRPLWCAEPQEESAPWEDGPSTICSRSADMLADKLTSIIQARMDVAKIVDEERAHQREALHAIRDAYITLRNALDRCVHESFPLGIDEIGALLEVGRRIDAALGEE